MPCNNSFEPRNARRAVGHNAPKRFRIRDERSHDPAHGESVDHHGLWINIFKLFERAQDFPISG
ncbi:MAG: hypothetical protein CMO80_19225 [Verrucomicrobiales bacterium]|nr:hypothetical protein [Verrucomicrobiales bacterium]